MTIKHKTFLEKVKVCFGNIFIKFPKVKTTEMIHQGSKDTHTSPREVFAAWGASVTSVFSFIDQQQLEEEIKALHKGLKAKVNRLHEIQGFLHFDRRTFCTQKLFF